MYPNTYYSKAVNIPTCKTGCKTELNARSSHIQKIIIHVIKKKPNKKYIVKYPNKILQLYDLIVRALLVVG